MSLLIHPSRQEPFKPLPEAPIEDPSKDPDTAPSSELLPQRETQTIKGMLQALAKKDPALATRLSHQLYFCEQIARCNWSSKELGSLRALGFSVQDPERPRLLGGMMEGVTNLAPAGPKEGIKLLANGNKEEVESRKNDRNIDATIKLPDGTLDEGYHDGERSVKVNGNGFLCFCPTYALVAQGNGEFSSKNVTYRGCFIDNLFDDNTGEAEYHIKHDHKYQGCFKEGKKEGKGKLDKYNPNTTHYHCTFDGEWKNDVPHQGIWYAENGEQLEVKNGSIADPLQTDTQPSVQLTIPLQQEPAPTPQSNPSFLQNTTPTSIAFGKAEWEQYFGSIGEEPPFPPNLNQVLESPCPVSTHFPLTRRKKVKETHLLVLIPQAVNGQAFTLNTLGEMIKNPREGHSAQYSRYEESVKTELGNKGISRSYWALVTKNLIPKSRGGYFDEKTSLLPEDYHAPKTLEIATAILMHHVKTGERLYPELYPKKPDHILTWCAETTDAHQRVLVGGFAPYGLIIDLGDDTDPHHSNGLGGTREV